MNWLMLRGLAREQRHWGDFPQSFMTGVPDAKVHLLDLPGAGTEFERTCPSTVPAIMEDLRQRWTVLKAENPGPWGLLGVSLGGMVAMQWCADHPDDFKRLVLVNSSARNLSAPHRRMGLSALPRLAMTLVDKDPVARERRVLGVITRLNPEEIDRVAREWAAYSQDRPISPRAAITQLLAAARFRAPLRITTPLLVLAGARDVLADPMCAYRLSRHFSAPLHVHPAAGHDLPLDDPTWISKQVQNWLS